MSPMIWKELRQGAGWAVLGLVAATFGLGYALETQRSNHAAFIEGVFGMTALVCPLAALIIALALVVPENKGDKWAFLTHRPVSRSALFFGKVWAGLLLYLIAAGIPLASVLAWIGVTQHLPMPFDWRMVLPGIADLFCGVAYYFAGVLIGMRDARWYGSRVAGVGAPIICSLAIQVTPQFWQAIFCSAIAIVITGTAAWGTFITGGKFDTQPLPARVATSLVTGAGVVLASLVAPFIIMIFFFVTFDTAFKSYMLTPDNTIAIVRQVKGRVTDVTDIEGHTISKYQDADFRQQWFAGNSAALRPLRLTDLSDRYRSASRFFVELQPPVFLRRTTWYYVTRLRLFAEYDNDSREVIGWLGPDGFSPGQTMPAHPFKGAPMFLRPWTNTYMPIGVSVLPFSDAVYRIDLTERELETLFRASSGESILGAIQLGNMQRRPGFIAISTTKRIVEEAGDGSLRLATPLEPDTADYVGVRVIRGAKRATFLWYYPAVNSVDRVSTPPQQVVRLGRDGSVETRYRLPFQPLLVTPPWFRVFLPSAALMPITVPLTDGLGAGRLTWHAPDTQLGTSSNYEMGIFAISGLESYSQSQLAIVWTLSALASTVPAILAYRRGRRYAFTAMRLTIWTGLAAILGPIGFLLMICLMDWPPRERCPACTRMRVGNRERCEHCGEPFPPPSSDGTEIFAQFA